MFRNLRVRNWKANYRLARRTSIISHFQSDIQGVFRFFTVCSVTIDVRPKAKKL